MSVPIIPNELNQVDFARVRFLFEFQEPCPLDVALFLGLRPHLGRIARQYFVNGNADGLKRYKALFDPDPGSDPVAVRKFQKPAPPFVLMLSPFSPVTVDAGEIFPLELLFLGTSIPLIGDFLSVLMQLGRSGLENGMGKFAVVEVSAFGEDGENQPIWHANDAPESLALPLDTFGSWLERQPQLEDSLQLQFDTPTRLYSGGRLLRRPTFVQQFPFMLRRVTSMMYAHADCEPWMDLDLLFQAAESIEVNARSFDWHDWKNLGEHRLKSKIGGFTGKLCLAGESLKDIFWVLAVAGLLGVGKGAAFGAGRFHLTRSLSDFT